MSPFPLLFSDSPGLPRGHPGPCGCPGRLITWLLSRLLVADFTARCSASRVHQCARRPSQIDFLFPCSELATTTDDVFSRFPERPHLIFCPSFQFFCRELADDEGMAPPASRLQVYGKEAPKRFSSLASWVTADDGHCCEAQLCQPVEPRER
jgi:hypothetical protein